MTNQVSLDTDQKLIVVSCDGHCGPSLENSLREYCPPKYLSDYDDYVRELRAGDFATDDGKADVLSWADRDMQRKLTTLLNGENDSDNQLAQSANFDVAAFDKHAKHPAHDDPRARLANMDEDGVAAEVIFAGGQNRELTPFIGFGADAGSKGFSAELRQAGGHIWNAWLTDYCSVAPERLIGVMQIPIYDVDAAIREIEWGAERGLKVVNFPAPRPDFPAYNHPDYEPLWDVCESLGLPLATHAGGGEDPRGYGGPGWDALRDYEKGWLTRRGVHQLIFGGVFDRHPDLKFVLTELRGQWMPKTLQELDETYRSGTVAPVRASLSRTAVEYFKSNCFNSGSFLARFEVELYSEHDLIDNLCYGRDFPHIEGTWPNTILAMQNSLGGFPEDTIRKILGINAIGLYNLDREVLQQVADKIGPRVSDLGTGPVPEESIPASRGLAFRTWGEND